MPINVSNEGNVIVVEYISEDGSVAEATVVGESLTSVKNRKEEIVDTHNLRNKADT